MEDDWDQEDDAIADFLDILFLRAISVLASLAALAVASLCLLVIVWCWRHLGDLLISTIP